MSAAEQLLARRRGVRAPISFKHAARLCSAPMPRNNHQYQLAALLCAQVMALGHLRRAGRMHHRRISVMTMHARRRRRNR